MLNRSTLPKFTGADVAFLLSGIMVIVDAIAIIAKVSNKQVTEISVSNPLSWILAPVTSSNVGWVIILVLTVLAPFVFLLGVRLRKRPARR